MFSLAQNYLTRGFWGDEAWTSLISQLPYLQMLKTTAADFHPPGYYTIVELVYKFLPPTEIVTRSISVFFYLATVLMVYKLATYISTSGESKPFRVNLQGEPTPKVIGKKRFWGLISAVVILVNPIFFTYAFEARNYTMFAFAATGSIYFLMKISLSLRGVNDEAISLGSDNRLPRGRWPLAMTKDHVLFVLFSALGIYTHYYMFFILAAQFFYLVVFDRKTFFPMIVVYFVIGILYLPWIPFLYGQLTSVSQNYWIGSIDQRTHFEAILRILGGEHKNFYRPLLFGLSISLMVVGLIQHLRQKSFEKPYILIWLWAVVPFILATLPGFRIGEFKLPFRPIFFWRYLIPASVPLGLVIVHAVQKLPNQISRLSIALVIVLSLVIDFWSFSRYPYTFKQVYEDKILSQIETDDKLVTSLPSFAEVLYYRNRSGLTNELIVLPEGLVQFSGKSLLDAYVENEVVTIEEAPDGGYFEMRPGPSVVKVERDRFPLEKQSVK